MQGNRISMKLQYFHSQAWPGEFNMAVDAALAGLCWAEQAVYLRFYRWSEPTATAGRTLPLVKANAARIYFPEAKIVRRPTGGGIVHHSNQMSFSVCWPRNSVQQLRGLRESYCFIHSVLLRSLKELGISARQIGCDEADPPGLLCSAAAVAGDLVSDNGNKVAGGAQWRFDKAVLYQGHLWLPWMPAVEESIAYSLATSLGLPGNPGDLPDSVTESAALQASSWQLLGKVA